VQFDLRVLKFFKVGAHGKLDFVVKSFNLLNHRKVVTLNQFYGPDDSPFQYSLRQTRRASRGNCNCQWTLSFDLNHSSAYPAAPPRDCARMTGYSSPIRLLKVADNPVAR
jgi:hypothetical protein